MILVLFFILILIALLIIVLIIISSITINIQHLESSNFEKINLKYKIVVSLTMFNKFKWINIKFDNEKLQKLFKKMHLEKITIKEIEKEFKLSDVKEIFNIKPRLQFLDLKIKIGLTDVILTSYTIPIICTIISIILPHITDNKDVKNISYNVNPIYNNKNVYSVKLNAIINIKVLNLLNSLYKIYRNRKKDMEERNLSYNT